MREHHTEKLIWLSTCSGANNSYNCHHLANKTPSIKDPHFNKDLMEIQHSGSNISTIRRSAVTMILDILY